MRARLLQVVRLIAASTLWLYSLPLLVVTLAFDALTWPLVITARHRARAATAALDAAPRSRRAAILVLNWNGAHFLRDLLPSLRIAVERARDLDGPHHVFVVDNGSSDDSIALVEREHSWARIVRIPENRFFIRGNRAGVEAVPDDVDVLVFLNNDMVVEPDFVRDLLLPFGAPSDARGLFATTARIEMQGARVETGRTRFFYKRGALRQEQLLGPSPRPREPAHWAGGGSSAFDRRKYAALGGFDDLYEPCYMEDVGLSYAAQKRGWNVSFVRSAGVAHVHRGTSSKVFGRRAVERLDRRNRELFFWRNVTDPGWLLSHALHLPWNAYKDARRSDLRLQFASLAAALPRLPRALRGRVGARAAQRRTDREVLGSVDAQA